jgi:hypothetical protein
MAGQIMTYYRYCRPSRVIKARKCPSKHSKPCIVAIEPPFVPTKQNNDDKNFFRTIKLVLLRELLRSSVWSDVRVQVMQDLIKTKRIVLSPVKLNVPSVDRILYR